MDKISNNHEAPPIANVLLADSASQMTCSCGKISNIPLCRECFDKGLLRSESRFKKPSGVSNIYFIWTMIVMAILGLIAAWLQL